MKLRARLTGTVLIGTLTMFGLAACGSDDSDNGDSGNNDSSSETTEDTGSDDSDEGNGDKPSKDEVVAGYSTIITDIVGELPSDIVNTVVTCFVDEVYDDASAQTLQAIADADATGIDPADTQLFTEASTTCQSQITGG